MSKIRSVNTKPEIIVRKNLYKKGFRYRINNKALPGKPDITILKYKLIIDVRGCFGMDTKIAMMGIYLKQTLNFGSINLNKTE